MAKKRLSDMGLFRRGSNVRYTPLLMVKVAIQVCRMHRILKLICMKIESLYIILCIP